MPHSDTEPTVTAAGLPGRIGLVWFTRLTSALGNVLASSFEGNHMHEDKTLVPILCMHRSGSSVTTNVLAELGMALGPFPLLGAAEGNRHGHFESLPFYDLDQQVQRLALGFSEDMPESPEVLQRFLESEGRWPEGVDLPPSWLDRGEELIHRLVATGAVSSFKDPRLPLVWPFWVEVFRRIPGLRVVPLVLMRSPHEIAMSIFMRSKGRFDYCDALDVTATHFKRTLAILADWPGPLARVRFLPEHFVEDLRATCRLLGLAWSEEVYTRVFDIECKHHEAAVVAHPAQAFFEQLSALPPQELTRAIAPRIETDALIRERRLRRNQVDAEVELASTQTALAGVRADLSATGVEAGRLAAELSAAGAEAGRLAAELSASKVEAGRLAAELSASKVETARLAAELSASKVETARLAAELSASEAEARRLAADLQVTKASRLWRLRELLVTLPGLKQLANRPRTLATSIEIRHVEGRRADPAAS